MDTMRTGQETGRDFLDEFKALTEGGVVLAFDTLEVLNMAIPFMRLTRI